MAKHKGKDASELGGYVVFGVIVGFFLLIFYFIKLIVEEAKSILFNDALRVRIKYINVMGLSKGVLEEFQKKLDSMSSELGLKYKEKLIQNNEERIIVSNTVIPTEDLDLIKNEQRDSTEEENEVLRKYLIIMLEYYTG